MEGICHNSNSCRNLSGRASFSCSALFFTCGSEMIT
jgi:hypothetical protein